MSEIEKNWQKIKEFLRDEYNLTEVSYNTWIKPLTYGGMEGSKLYIIFPDESKKSMIDFITKKYLFLIQLSIEEVTGIQMDLSDLEIVFSMPNSAKKDENVPYLNKPSISSSVYERANLNPKYTFDTFVVGANNKLAHAASLAVAESPADKFNPFFIYGGVGLGKTHLMHSIAQFVLKNNPNARVLYITSENFMNELIDSIKNKNPNAMSEFRNKYRTNDVLLIDDIQFIANKEGTQEEFFHTFNALYEAKKQIVISSDKPPKALTTLEERLRSRFEMGLSVDISSPDYETRMAILRKKEEMEGYNIDNEVLKYIASNIKSNIRELEGALTKIIAFSKLNKMEINVETAQEALKDLISPDAVREITPELIIHVVSEHFSIRDEDIISSKKSKDIAYPRQIAMYLCKSMTSATLQNIGKVMGNRDHTTIMHGCEKIAKEMNENESLRSSIDILTKKINPS